MKPCELAACDARELISRRELSPVELTQSCIEQIERYNPGVNAVVTTAFEQALAEAKEAESGALRGEARGALYGLPVAIKDSHDTRGIRTTYGSPHFKDHVPVDDEHCVTGVRQAGGIVLCKTNIPEMSIGGNTVNRLFGATGNPFDSSKTCGGSSGGSATALACNMAPLATGSDTGGSLRLPASFCGVVAHRPSAGVVSHPQRSMTQTYYGTQGPMARTVKDAALLLSAMSLRSKRDPMSYPLDSGQFAQLEEIDPSSLRIAVTADLGGVPVSRDIREVFGKRVRALESLVGTCDWVDPRLGEAMDVFWKLRSIYFIANYSHEIDSWDRDFNPNILSNYAAALKMDLKSVAEAHRMQMALYQHVQDVLERYDAIVCPGVSISPFPWVDLFPKSIEGLPSENYVGWVGMTSALTVVGNPITTIPCGVDSVGMPFGLQVVGQNFEDRRTLGVAHALERAFAGLDELKRPTPNFEKLLTPLQPFA